MTQSSDDERADGGLFTAVTRAVEVTVSPRYEPERSDEDAGTFFWTYTVEIANTGTRQVQLTHRHWIITDAAGRRQEVRGVGVVGEQPVLEPGESFQYTSGCPLPTSSGFMVGFYRMVEASGTIFEAEIPMFPLDTPATRRMLH